MHTLGAACGDSAAFAEPAPSLQWGGNRAVWAVPQHTGQGSCRTLMSQQESRRTPGAHTRKLAGGAARVVECGQRPKEAPLSFYRCAP